MTLFTAELAQAIADELKKQTRRPIKKGDYLEIGEDGTKTVYNVAGKIKMQRGRNYSIQWGRGKPCRWWHPEKKELLDYDHYLWTLESVKTKQRVDATLREVGYVPFRYELTDIRQEDVRHITHADAIAEGFEYAPKYSFLHTWMMFYDDTFAYQILYSVYDANKPDACPDFLWDRPAEKYQAFAYTFKIYLPDGYKPKQKAKPDTVLSN